MLVNTLLFSCSSAVGDADWLATFTEVLSGAVEACGLSFGSGIAFISPHCANLREDISFSARKFRIYEDTEHANQETG